MDENRAHRRLWEIVCEEKSVARPKIARTWMVADVTLQMFSCATCIIEDNVRINFKRKTMHEKRNSWESKWKSWRPTRFTACMILWSIFNGKSKYHPNSLVARHCHEQTNRMNVVYGFIIDVALDVHVHAQFFCVIAINKTHKLCMAFEKVNLFSNHILKTF